MRVIPWKPRRGAQDEHRQPEDKERSEALVRRKFLRVLPLCVELAQGDSRPACQSSILERKGADCRESEQSEKELKESQASLTVMSGSPFSSSLSPFARSQGFPLRRRASSL